MKEEYLQLYRNAVEKHHFEPSEEEGEIMRYLLVCGLVPATPENIRLVKEEFYIDVPKLPKELVDKILTRAKKNRSRWVFDEDTEEEELERVEDWVMGAWIKNAVITGAKIGTDRKVKMITISMARMKLPIE